MIGDEERLLFANDAFYAAFASADIRAMQDLWADKYPVSVIHPGADIVVGRAEVLASWKAILRDDTGFDIEHRNPVARLLGETGIVLCRERVGTHHLIATNVFVRIVDNWRIAHHQSGPAPLQAKPKQEEQRPVH